MLHTQLLHTNEVGFAHFIDLFGDTALVEWITG